MQSSAHGPVHGIPLCVGMCDYSKCEEQIMQRKLKNREKYQFALHKVQVEFFWNKILQIMYNLKGQCHENFVLTETVGRGGLD